MRYHLNLLWITLKVKRGHLCTGRQMKTEEEHSLKEKISVYSSDPIPPLVTVVCESCPNMLFTRCVCTILKGESNELLCDVYVSG